MNERAQPLRVDTISSLDGVRAAREAWRGLARAGGAAAQPDYVEAAILSGLASDDLRILLAYAQDRMVGVWPLHAVRSGKTVILRHIGGGSREEYAAPTVCGDDPPAVLAALWATAASHADVVELYNLEAGTAAQMFFSGLDARSRHVTTSETLQVRFSGRGWPAWLADRPKSWRDKLKYYRKRLAALGAVTFEQVSAADALSHAQWCMDTKGLWLDAHGIKHSWLRGPGIIQFFGSMIGRGTGIEGFALKVDGIPVAGCLCLIGAGRAEFFMTVYDEAWAAHSPGNVLIEHVAQWCAGQGLDLDFRFPAMPYKAHWANDSTTVTTLSLAVTRAGAVEIARRKRADAFRRAKAKAGKLLRLLRSRGGGRRP